MTNLGYIKSQLGSNYPLEDEFFKGVLLNQGIAEGDMYEPSRAFDISFIHALWMLIASANRISEGGVTITLDVNAIKSVISWLYRKNGMDDLTKDGYVTGKPTRLW